MALILFIAFIGLKYNNEESEKSILNKQTCSSLKGIAALFIILFHLYQKVDFSGLNALFKPFSPAMLLSNGMFFLFSGYGLQEKLKQDFNYLCIKFYLRRLISILFPAYLIYLLSYLLKPLNTTPLWFYILGGGIIIWIKTNDVVWFLIELVFLYTLFWVIYKKRNRMISNCIMGTIILSWIVFAFLSHRGIVWYASTLCFLEGIIISQNKENVCRLLNNKKMYVYTLVILISVLVLSMYIFCQYEPWTFLSYVLATNMSTLTFSAILILVTYRIKIGNRITSFLGEISYEMYLIHKLLIILFIENGTSDTIVIWGTILCTIGGGKVLHILTKIIMKRVYEYER